MLPWTVVTETVVDRKFHPTFPKYLKELEGKQIQLDRLQCSPWSDDQQESGAFLLIEYPVGCWYCEMPEVTRASCWWSSKRGQDARRPRAASLRARPAGWSSMQARTREDFLYTIKDAKAVQTDE